MAKNQMNGSIWKWLTATLALFVISVTSVVAKTMLTTLFDHEQRITTHDEAFKYIKDSLARILRQQNN